MLNVNEINLSHAFTSMLTDVLELPLQTVVNEQCRGPDMGPNSFQNFVINVHAHVVFRTHFIIVKIALECRVIV